MNAITRDVRSVPGGVWVEASARLHMGFIDLNGQLGRRFGSLGMTVEGIGVRLCAVLDDSMRANGLGAARATECARRLALEWGLRAGARFDIEEMIPEHVGLGSGTQLSLAVGTALARLYGVRAGARDIARTTERGARSGIGIGAFERGGFLVDGGQAPDATLPPPVTVRLDVPANWRILLVLEQCAQGLHGSEEAAAFGALPPFSAKEAAHLSRLVLMRMLPAIAEADLEGFGAAVTEIQRRVGDHFAPAQGGRFSSPRVAAALQWLSDRGAVGIGQSSWGPTGFCLVNGEEWAQTLAANARRHFRVAGSLAFLAVSPRNVGSRVWPCESEAARHSGSIA